MYTLASLLSVYNRGFHDCSFRHSRHFMAYSVLNVNLPLWQDRNANDSLTDAKSWSFPAVHFRVISAAILDITQWNYSGCDENVFRHSYKGLFKYTMRSYQQRNFQKAVSLYISYEALLNLTKSVQTVNHGKCVILLWQTGNYVHLLNFVESTFGCSLQLISNNIAKVRSGYQDIWVSSRANCLSLIIFLWLTDA